jgi:hypothetical protein
MATTQNGSVVRKRKPPSSSSTSSAEPPTKVHKVQFPDQASFDINEETNGAASSEEVDEISPAPPQPSAPLAPQVDVTETVTPGPLALETTQPSTRPVMTDDSPITSANGSGDRANKTGRSRELWQLVRTGTKKQDHTDVL